MLPINVEAPLVPVVVSVNAPCLLLNVFQSVFVKDPVFVEKLIHLNNQYYNLQKMPEPVDSIPRLAMFLAVIRPGKKHLIGERWSEVAKTVWDKGTDGYTFKQSHAISYSWLVAVHMNLLG